MAIEALSDISRAGTSAFAAPGGGGSFYVATVDFGSLGKSEGIFDVAVTGAAVGQKVLASASLDMPGSVPEDELEMDMLAVAGRVLSTDNVRLIVASMGGRITGQRNINLILG